MPRLPEPEAVDLLRKLVDNEAATPKDLTALAKLLGGHPLALELAAGSLNLCDGAGEIADLLAKYEQGLKDGVPFDKLELGEEAGAKEDSLIVTFQHSYDALDPDLQRRFRAMGVFAPDAPWDIILTIPFWSEVSEMKEECSAEETEIAIKATIKALRMHGLLAQTKLEGYPEGWYEPHPLLRSYARALLMKTGELDAMRERYAEASIAMAYFGFRLPKQEWHNLAPYFPHIHAVGDDLYTRIETILGDLEPLAQPKTINRSFPRSLLEANRILLKTCCDFATAVKEYVWFRRETGESGRHWLVMGLASARMLEQKQAQALFCGVIASWYDQRGHKSQALVYFEQGLTLLRELKDRWNEATALGDIGLVHHALGNYQRALDYITEALAITREVGDRSGEATDLNNIGLVYYALGNRQQALNYYNQALPIIREVGDRPLEAAVLNNIGLVYVALDDHQQALRYFNEALPITREVGDRSGEVITLNNICSSLFSTGEYEYDEVLKRLEEILPVVREIGNRYGEAMVLFNMSRVSPNTEAVQLIEQARDIWRAIGSPDVQWADARLAALRGETPPAASDGIPPHVLAMTVTGTIAVMTIYPEDSAEFRDQVTQNLEIARRNNAEQDAAFFKALLALLDGEEAALPADHPYADALRQILDGIAEGGDSA